VLLGTGGIWWLRRGADVSHYLNTCGIAPSPFSCLRTRLVRRDCGCISVLLRWFSRTSLPGAFRLPPSKPADVLSAAFCWCYLTCTVAAAELAKKKRRASTACSPVLGLASSKTCLLCDGATCSSMPARLSCPAALPRTAIHYLCRTVVFSTCYLSWRQRRTGRVHGVGTVVRTTHTAAYRHALGNMGGRHRAHAATYPRSAKHAPVPALVRVRELGPPLTSPALRAAAATWHALSLRYCFGWDAY